MDGSGISQSHKEKHHMFPLSGVESRNGERHESEEDSCGGLEGNSPQRKWHY